jgi:hypothetical protein
MSHSRFRKLLGALFPRVGAIVALSGMFVLGCQSKSSDNPYEKPADEVFGVKGGEPISTGFVFKDGVYVEAPYVVSRRGGDIYVNDVKAATSATWPPVDYEDKKPEMPAGLTKDSTFKDLEIRERPGDSLDRKMVRWLKRHHDGDKAQALIVEYYKSLPFVKDVKFHNDMKSVIVISTWYRDKDILMDIGGPGEGVYYPPSVGQVLDALERARKRMEKPLKDGDCLFFFSHDGDRHVGVRDVPWQLPDAVRVLRGSETKEQKIKELQRIGLFDTDFPKSWEILITNFSASKQLDARLKQLPMPIGKRPHTAAEERAAADKAMREKAAIEAAKQK